MNPNEIFTQKMIQRIGELEYSLLQVQTQVQVLQAELDSKNEAPVQEPE